MKARESRFGQTEVSTKAGGRIVKLTAKAGSFMLMGMCMWESGKMTRLMARECTAI